MSQITNVILTTRFEDQDNADKLDTIVNFRSEVGLVSCDDPKHGTRWYGGDVHLGMNICIGACNWLDLTELVLGMRSISWVDPDCVQLFVCGEDDARFVEVDWQQTTERPADDRMEI